MIIPAVTTIASPTLPTTATAVPTPRPAVEQATQRRRRRPASQYWDVYDACWRTSEGVPAQR